MKEVLIQKYLASFEDKILNINRALESSDIQVLTHLIHQLAGSSGSYGFTQLSDQCLLIEKMMIDKTDLNDTIKCNIESLLELMKGIQQAD